MTTASQLLIDCTLTRNDLDQLIERSNRLLGLDTSLKRDVTSIRNYLKSGDLARGETAYLEDEKDLFYVSSARNNELRRLQPVMEGLTRGLCKVFGKVESRQRECDSESNIRTEYM